MTLVEELRNKVSRDNRELLDRAANEIEGLQEDLEGAYERIDELMEIVQGRENKERVTETACKFQAAGMERFADALHGLLRKECLVISDERGVQGYMCSSVHYAIDDVKKKLTEGFDEEARNIAFAMQLLCGITKEEAETHWNRRRADNEQREAD